MKQPVPVSPVAKVTIGNGSKRPVPVTVMTQNDLAMDVLNSILDDDPAILRIRTEQMMRSNGCSRDVHIFVIDQFGLMPPVCSLIGRLKRSHPNAKYIVLGKNADAAQVTEMLPLGIDAYVPYNKASASLTQAIHAVADGKLWVDRDALALYVKRNVRYGSRGAVRASDAITPRENEILQFVREWFTNQEIAQHLDIRESTVKFHLSNIYSKLHVTSRREIVSGRVAV
jgi:DNA-binding NarL/FixJ family response regulator